MEACTAFEAAASYAPNLLAAIDCNFAQLAHLGFDALSAPGSPVMLSIGGMLTLFVALLGYRLILGGTIETGQLAAMMFKIGLTLTLITQWPAYQTLFYNTVINGPGELLAKLPFAETTRPQGLSARLQASYDALADLEMPERVAAATSSAALRADPFASAQRLTSADTSYGSFLSFRPMSAGMFLLFSGLFALALPRVIAGLMLALGPIFIGFLLFDATRSIFLGWLRALAWTVVAGVLASIILDIELGVAEPQIGALIDEFAAGTSGLATLGELLATVMLFSLLTFGGMIAALAPTRIKAWPARLQTAAAPLIRDIFQSGTPSAVNSSRPHNEEQPTRGQALGSRLAVMVNNQSASSETGSAASTDRRIEALSNTSRSSQAVPLGQSYRESAGPRRSAIPVRRAKTK